MPLTIVSRLCAESHEFIFIFYETGSIDSNYIIYFKKHKKPNCYVFFNLIHSR
jgi:hypothetical protein